MGCTRVTLRLLQVANAGVGETGEYFMPRVKNGKPEKPIMATVDVNLLGTIYSEDNSIYGEYDNYLIRIHPSCTPGYALLGTCTEARG